MEGIVLGLGLSLHSGFENDYNGVHPYIEYQNGNFRMGAFYNSEENISSYGGVNIPLSSNFSVDTGLVTGYEALSDENNIFLGAIPYARLNYRLSDNLSVFAAPGAEVQDNETNFGLVSGLTLNF